jgi:hypothetical protein
LNTPGRLTRCGIAAQGSVQAGFLVWPQSLEMLGLERLAQTEVRRIGRHYNR